MARETQLSKGFVLLFVFLFSLSFTVAYSTTNIGELNVRGNTTVTGWINSTLGDICITGGNCLSTAGGAGSSFNATYALYAYNQTLPAQSYADVQIAANTTFITGRITTINSTTNIQQLLNLTNIYSTYNVSYALYAYNQTILPFKFTSTTIYNDTTGINLGLGISTPTEKLTVAGQINITQNGLNLTVGNTRFYNNGSGLIIS